MPLFLGAFFVYVYLMKNMRTLYEEKLNAGDIRQDDAQLAVLDDLDVVKTYLEKSTAVWQPFGKAFKWVDEDFTIQKPKGLYFYGSVGRGKSMLMDLFFQNVQVEQKRRVHFHEFMGEVHERMHQGGFEKGVDPVHKIAMDIAKEARLLCFDEFYISNIADAMMLGRLFEMLMKTGVIICTTSNWAPEDLFQGGHNRVLFKPFIKMISGFLNILSLGDGKDWRVDGNPELRYYFEGHNTKALKENWKNNFGDFTEQQKLHIEGGEVQVYVSESRNACYVSFKELCGQAFASEQYINLSELFDTVFVEGIPTFDIHMQDEAMRFVVMVDIFYEKGTTFVCSASQNPEDLCPEGESAFAFQRTASRLREMQSRSIK